MSNASAIVQSHNNHVQRKRQTQGQENTGKKCNCQGQKNSPMNGDCRIQSIVFKVSVSITRKDEQKECFGLAEPPFKQRYDNFWLMSSGQQGMRDWRRVQNNR
eukprot:scpid110224/ scgid17102/ 